MEVPIYGGFSVGVVVVRGALHKTEGGAFWYDKKPEGVGCVGLVILRPGKIDPEIVLHETVHVVHRLREVAELFKRWNPLLTKDLHLKGPLMREEFLCYGISQLYPKILKAARKAQKEYSKMGLASRKRL